MKKVLSLVLSLALVLSSFSMAFADEPAKAEPTPAGKAGANLSDVAKSKNKEAIGVVNDLGIVIGTPEGTFLPEKDVTRAEFAAMITRALAIPMSALEGYQKAPFNDMAGYEWSNGYLAFCVSKGIMVGDGMGNAMPGRTVTLNEAMTMALRAIGYVDNSSELKGAWPANFVTKAQELDLYNHLAKDAVVANRETSAQLIYNLLTAPKVAVDTDGKTAYVRDKDGNKVNLLTAGLGGVEEKAAVVTISDLDNSAINMAKYLGMFGTKYTTKSGKYRKTIAFMPDRDYTTLVGRVIVSGGKYKFVTTGDETTYEFDGVATTNDMIYLENGESKGTKEADDASFLASAILTPPITVDSGKAPELTLHAVIKGKKIVTKEMGADPDGAGPLVAPVLVQAVVNKWTISNDKIVDANDVAELKSARLLGRKFVKEGNEIDTKTFQLMGVANLSDISADNVVYTYVADSKIVRVDVGTETVEGMVKKFKPGSHADGAVDVFTIGDKELMNAGYSYDAAAKNRVIGVENFYSKHGDTVCVSPDYVTEEVKVALDARGYVYDVVKSNKADKYALVIREEFGGLEDKAKVMLSDGTEKVLDVKLSPKAGLGDLDDSVTGASGLVAYGLNKDGKITSVDRSIATVKYLKGAVEFKSNAVMKVKSTGRYFYIKKDAPVFMYDDKDPAHAAVGTKNPTNPKAEFSLTSMDKVNKEDNKDELRVLVKDDQIYALLVSSTDAKAGAKKYAVVNEADRVAVNDNHVLSVEGFIDGVAFNKNTDDVYSVIYDRVAKYDDGNSKVQLFDVTLNKDGVIIGVEEVVKNKDLGSDNPMINTKVEHNTEFIQVAATNDRRAIKIDDTLRYLAVKDGAVFYKLNSKDKYEVTTAVPRKGDFVKAYELDGELGYDVVFVVGKDDLALPSVKGNAKVSETVAGSGVYRINVNTAGRYILKYKNNYYKVSNTGVVTLQGANLLDATTAADAALNDTGDLAPVTNITTIGSDPIKAGETYHLINVEKAYAKVVGENEIKAKDGATSATAFKAEGDNALVTIEFVGAKVKNGTTISQIFADHADVGTTDVDLELNAAITSDVSTVVIKGVHDSINNFVAGTDDPVLNVAKAQLQSVDYAGGDVIYSTEKGATYKTGDTNKLKVVVRP